MVSAIPTFRDFFEEFKHDHPEEWNAVVDDPKKNWKSFIDKLESYTIDKFYENNNIDYDEFNENNPNYYETFDDFIEAQIPWIDEQIEMEKKNLYYEDESDEEYPPTVHYPEKTPAQRRKDLDETWDMLHGSLRGFAKTLMKKGHKKEARQIFTLLKFAGKCPYCGDPDAYLGAGTPNAIECANPSCKAYSEKWAEEIRRLPWIQQWIVNQFPLWHKNGGDHSNFDRFWEQIVETGWAEDMLLIDPNLPKEYQGEDGLARAREDLEASKGVLEKMFHEDAEKRGYKQPVTAKLKSAIRPGASHEPLSIVRKQQTLAIRAGLAEAVPDPESPEETLKLIKEKKLKQKHLPPTKIPDARRRMHEYGSSE